MLIRHSFRYMLAAAAISTTILIVYLTRYDNVPDVEEVVPERPASKSNLLILPPNSRQFLADHPEIVEQAGNPHVLHVDSPHDEPLTPQHGAYRDHVLEVYDSKESIQLNTAKCNTLKQKATVQVDQATALKVSLHHLMEELLREVEEHPQGYLGEISPFFVDELRLQIKDNVVDIFWSRLAGSSVWLKDYGVHFVISRVIYHPKAVRNQPVFSVVYAQLYDEHWNELTDTRLVVPSNEGSYQVMKFPSFLPIPFFHDVDDPKIHFYGPEDAHVSLIKNKAGYEEPLLIYNSYHRKFGRNEKFDETSKAGRKQASFYRSMFLSWPFQFQKGKQNTDGDSNSQYDDKIYNRVMELQIKDQPRAKKQKNWVPLISHNERQEHGYDRDLYLVYRWSNFETLKCDISEGDGKCTSNFKLNEKLNPSTEVGPLRGGTQMLNINELIQTQTDVPLDQIIPAGREIWAGFPRAHLDDCGCGDKMYRPNLVVLARDTIISDKEGTSELNSYFKITHASSSVSFDIPIIGWDIADPTKVCHASNVLIPNGISAWKVEDLHKDELGRWKVTDQMTVMLSIADFTVHRVNIQGLLEEILNLNNPTLVLHSDQKQDTPEGRSALGLLEADVSGDSTYRVKMGYNDDNIQCAIQASRNFCKAYGEVNVGHAKSSPEYDQFVKENAVPNNLELVDKYITDLKQAEKSSGRI